MRSSSRNACIRWRSDVRFLANENFPAVAVAALRERGHDVTWAGESFPSAKDRDVLALAVAEDRVLLTFDKDFGELAFRRGLPATCGVVLFRVATPSAAEVARFVVAALASRDGWTGLFSVIDEGKVRSRSLPVPAGTLTPIRSRRPRRVRTRRPQGPAAG